MMLRRLPLRVLLVAFGIALVWPMVLPALAQIANVAVETNGVVRLREMNADGTGDTIIPLPFLTFGNPTWSRDGTQLAFSALDPSRPTQRSQNVFSINM